MSVNANTQATETASDLFQDSSEDELDFSVTQNIFRRANAKYVAKDFAGARELIASGLTQARRLSSQDKKSLQIREMQLKLAFYYFRERSFNIAQDFFLNITKNTVDDTAALTRVLHAMHGLAKLNLQMRNYEAAVNHCRQAMRGRRRARSIGKTHPDYFASLRLLALIMWAKGNKTEAEAHANLLPEAQRLCEADFSQILKTEYGILEGTAKKQQDISMAPLSEPKGPKPQQSAPKYTPIAATDGVSSKPGTAVSGHGFSDGTHRL
jgi:hypothetical protein